jgi:Tol biopolymer transport system component
MKTPFIRLILLTIITFLLFPAYAKSQYFGRNKPTYKSFEFDVIKTPNFDIYTYLDNDTLINNFAQWSEEWYSMHQKIFKDTFSNNNPLILYSTHSDFQQTNAIQGQIGTSTGGVTEALKNRVIMPVAPTLAQTDHVLGHELVHAFQFNKLLRTDSTSNYNINNIPLWMIEGMAEYFSIGSVDPNTAMWMRDALINDDFPTLKQLSTESKYFPYRYGHAFWAMIGKTWGDTLIVPIFEKTAHYGLDKALDTLLGFESKTLSGLWKNSMETHYNKYLKDSSEYIAGKKIISAKNTGRMNLSPSLSPDGRYLAFFSQKSVFTLDLYLADTKTGKIIKKISSVTRNHEIDDFSFIESSGTWSPDSKKFAFVVFQKGKNMLVIVDVDRSRIIEEIEFEGIASFSNPQWSPDGRYFVFSGLVNGIGDLYLYDLETKSIIKLTDDFVSNIHPSWSPDGNYIVFSTEKFNAENNKKKYSFDLYIIDIRTKKIKRLDVFPGADNLNPQFASKGNSIYFLSNADGFRNLYCYKTDSQIVYRITEYNTGISGLTPYSPAISTSRLNDLIAYTHYYNNKYEIYTAKNSDFQYKQVDKTSVDFEPGTLPPLNHYYINVVDSALYNRNFKETIISPDSIEKVPYKPKFKLDYISNTAGIGVSTGRYSTNNMSGSVTMIFSDIVGNNQLYSVLALNGEIYDFGGQIAYINNTKKFNWGAYVSHIPYRSGELAYFLDTLTFNNEDEKIKLPVINMQMDYWRMFEDNISLFTYRAFSQTRRIEAGLSSAWYYYRIERYNMYYDEYGSYIGYDKKKLSAPEGSNYQKIDIAFVQDNSYFGMTSPMRGGRARYQIEKYFGTVNFFTGLIDYRKYYFINPFTFAFRLYHYGRYGKSSESNLVYPIYIGYPWLVRGYEDISFYNNNMNNMRLNSYNYSLLSGSKAFVGNAELRFPLSGPKSLALIGSKYFLTDLNIFFDSGLAWNKWDQIKLAWQQNSFSERIPVFSAGSSLRVNVMGYLIVELYYAIPFQNGGWSNGVFGINFVPGW